MGEYKDHYESGEQNPKTGEKQSPVTHFPPGSKAFPTKEGGLKVVPPKK
jgi:hypothetical protein